ncbi:MAG: glycosyltransferase family 4 protein [Eubacteriales bacterium]
MNVLYITNNAKLYGGNHAMLAMILDLREQYGINPTVLLLEEGDLTTRLKALNINYIVQPFAGCFVEKGKNKFRPLLYYFRMNYKAIKLLKEKIIKMECFEIIHTNTSVIDIGYFLSKYLGVKHIWHIREVGDHYNIRPLLPKSIFKYQLNQANAIITISKFVKNVIHLKYHIDGNLELVYDGVLPNSDYVKCEDNSNDKLQFCMVGLISDKKNQLDVIQAVNQLSIQFKNQFEITFVGEGKETYQCLQEYIQQENLMDYVKLLGYQKEVYPILESMDVGIMASECEAFGRTTVEYMMHYMPVIASRSGANLELVQEDVNGLIFDNHDVNGIVKCMQYCLENREKVCEMGKNAHEFAMERFTTKMNTDDIYRVYREISGDKIL